MSLPPFVVDALRTTTPRHVDSGGTDRPGVRRRSLGGSLGPVLLQAVLHEARDATGLTEFTLHDLRHAAGTMAAWTA